MAELPIKKVLLIEPIGKPRVLRGERSRTADKWRRYKADIQWLAKKVGLVLPANYFHVVFYISPPSSWSEKKRQAALGQPVKVKPDIDNCVKALLDSLHENDSHFWDIRSTKLYGIPARIEIFLQSEENPS